MSGRQDDILEILASVSEFVQTINEISYQARTDESIRNLDRVKVKNCLENLRSCLDYLARDIAENKGLISSKKRIYFPYGKDENSFKSMLNQHLKGLDGSILKLIESVQPHKCNDKWLYDLCNINNVKKHNNLGKQRRVNEDAGVDLGVVGWFGEGSNVTMNNVVISGCHSPVSLSFVSGETPLKDINKSLNGNITAFESYDNVDYIDQESDVSLLELIGKSYSGLSKLVDNVYKEINDVD